MLHISTSTQGGAGIAASRLNVGLQEIGVNSKILTFELARSLYIDKTITRKFFYSFQSKFFTLINLLMSNKSYFSVYSSRFPNIYSYQFGEPANTIIHIHNWFNTLNVEDLEIIFSKGFKIVFTFHDERLLTGGCHSSLECRYFGNCILCPGKGRIVQRKITNNLEKQLECFEKNQGNYAIITPSGWLLNRTRKFREIRAADVVKIPNFFPPTLSLSRPQNSTANQTSTIRLGIASLDPFNFIKGGDLVKQISRIGNQEKLQIELVFLKSFIEHSDFWYSIDALLVPSVSDNSPNVIFEAAQFEIPVIATRVGGIPELLNADVDLLFDSTITGLLVALREMKTRLKDSDFQEKLKSKKDFFVQQNSLTLRKHLELYQTLLDR